MACNIDVLVDNKNKYFALSNISEYLDNLNLIDMVFFLVYTRKTAPKVIDIVSVNNRTYDEIY